MVLGRPRRQYDNMAIFYGMVHMHMSLPTTRNKQTPPVYNIQADLAQYICSRRCRSRVVRWWGGEAAPSRKALSPPGGGDSLEIAYQFS